jgi:hypothetical protein
MGAIMGTLIAAGYLVAMIGVKERSIDETQEQSFGLRYSLKIVLANKAFRWFLGANISKEYIWLLLAGMLPFWRKYALGIQSNITVFGVSLRLARQSYWVCLSCRHSTLDLASHCRTTWLSLNLDIGTLTFHSGLLVMAFATDFYSSALVPLTVLGLPPDDHAIPCPSEIIDEDAGGENGFRREAYFRYEMVSSNSPRPRDFCPATAITGFASGSDVDCLAIHPLRSASPRDRSLIVACTRYPGTTSSCLFAILVSKGTLCTFRSRVFEGRNLIHLGVQIIYGLERGKVCAATMGEGSTEVT